MGSTVVNLANCRRLGTRYGDFWHAYPPDQPRAVCGITRPIFPAANARHRPMCPRCATYFQNGGDAVADRAQVAASEPVVTAASNDADRRVKPSDRALAARDRWLAANPDFARTMTHPLIRGE